MRYTSCAKAAFVFPLFYFVCTMISVAIMLSALISPFSRKWSRALANHVHSLTAPHLILFCDLFSPISYQLSGEPLDTFADEKVILICNHLTFLDWFHTIILAHILNKDNCKFFVRGDVRRIPFVGQVRSST